MSCPVQVGREGEEEEEWVLGQDLPTDECEEALWEFILRESGLLEQASLLPGRRKVMHLPNDRLQAIPEDDQALPGQLSQGQTGPAEQGVEGAEGALWDFIVSESDLVRQTNTVMESNGRTHPGPTRSIDALLYPVEEVRLTHQRGNSIIYGLCSRGLTPQYLLRFQPKRRTSYGDKPVRANSR